MTNNSTHTGAVVEVTAADFIPFPAKSLTHRGVSISRSTLVRGWKSGSLKTKLFRLSGSMMGRRYILAESLNQWLETAMTDELAENAHLNGKRTKGGRKPKSAK
jgi:hypothetical protein